MGNYPSREEPEFLYPDDAESLNQNGEKSGEQHRTVKVGIPRGLQVICLDTDKLIRGFRYPPVLLAYGISKTEWEGFSASLQMAALAETNIAFAVEGICDMASRWDKDFFRPRGLLMRLDMPGEEKYGIDFMDLFYTRNTFNVGRKLYISMALCLLL